MVGDNEVKVLRLEKRQSFRHGFRCGHQVSFAFQNQLPKLEAERLIINAEDTIRRGTGNGGDPALAQVSGCAHVYAPSCACGFEAERLKMVPSDVWK